MRFFLTIIGIIYLCPVLAQLEQGSWYQLPVSKTGVYRIDGQQLKSWGISLNGLNASSIRLYGNGGGMLPEANGIAVPNGLTENAILVADGGDGIFNEQDFFLFYGQAPDTWQYDASAGRHLFQKHLYAKENFYYLTIGGTGLRINGFQPSGSASYTVTDFEDRYHYESDLDNLLKSGKEWIGEEFSLSPGKKNVYQFAVNFPHIISGTQALFRTSLAARSVGASSNFGVQINGQTILNQSISPVFNDPYAPIANMTFPQANWTISQSAVNVQFAFNTGSVGGTGWLNWFELFVKRKLDLSGIDQLLFYQASPSSMGAVADFRLANADPSVIIWNISDPLRPRRMITTPAGNEMIFLDSVRGSCTWVAFRPQNYLRISSVNMVPNQSLRALSNTDYLIVTHPNFLTQAQRLAQWHQTNQQLNTVVVTTGQIYHEFSSGKQDPSAIRNFVRYLHQKALTNNQSAPKYLLLFGDGSYDYLDRVAGNTNFVPVYESVRSLEPLETYTSDDFFGYLEPSEDINLNQSSTLDIGIGRIPAKTPEEATSTVDKIIRYHETSSYGFWRNEITLVADDQDNNLHFDDAEEHARLIQSTTNRIPQKIYLDAYRQQSGSGGSRYPEATLAVNNRILSGTMIWNYSGHGGFRRLAEEVILDNDMVNSWDNSNKLPLFVTATCDFAPYDNPQINSLGENLLLRPRTGAIALMTTTRVVFAFSNRIINNNFFRAALQPEPDGKYLTLGEAIRRTKNLTSNDPVNNRKFTLLGDPAMRLGFPDQKVRTVSVNGKPITEDTLKALNQYEIKGEVTDVSGNKLTDFNGEVYPVIYDKSQRLSTRKNDPDSRVAEFSVQNNIIFKGKTRAVNGEFSYSFIVPKDINYSFGKGLVSYYAWDGKRSAGANEQQLTIGGVSTNPLTDQTGPQIRAFLNDQNFVNGGIVNQTPLLILQLFDSSGINSAGAGIGHDITAMIDDQPNQFYVMNDFYVADEGSFQRGSVRFQLPAMEEGFHFLTIKVWDVLNNSSTYRLEFNVVKDRELTLANVYNYPNPFTTSTRFMFEHNRPGDQLQATIQIFTVSGQLVKKISQTINSKGNRSFELEWDGTDHFGRKVGRGVYIYQVDIKDSQGKKQSARQKLVLL